MTFHAYMLVITGSLWMAYFTILQKRYVAYWKGLDATFTALYLLVGALTLFAISIASGGAEVADKVYTFKIFDWEIGIGFWLAASFSGILNIGFQVLRTKANVLEDSSLVTPILATTPAVVIVTSMIIMNEYPSLMGKMGILLLVMGGYVLNIQEYLNKRAKVGVNKWYDFLAPFVAIWRSRGMRYAFIAAMIGAVSLNFDGITARTANIGFGFGLIALIASFGSLVVAAAFGEIGKKTLPTLNGVILIGFFWAVGAWFFSMAYRETMVPYVGALKRLYIPLNAIMAWGLLKERVTGWRLAGGLTMALGAAVMGLKDGMFWDLFDKVSSWFN